MSQQEFREKMLAYRADAERSADERKDTQIVLNRLERLYSSFDPKESAEANAVLAEWILSDSQGLRFDARHLAWKFHISDLTEALRESAAKLAVSNLPGEPEEALTVDNLLKLLLTEKVAVMPRTRAYPASTIINERVG